MRLNRVIPVVMVLAATMAADGASKKKTSPELDSVKGTQPVDVIVRFRGDIKNASLDKVRGKGGSVKIEVERSRIERKLVDAPKGEAK